MCAKFLLNFAMVLFAKTNVALEKKKGREEKNILLTGWFYLSDKLTLLCQVLWEIFPFLYDKLSAVSQAS